MSRIVSYGHSRELVMRIEVIEGGRADGTDLVVTVPEQTKPKESTPMVSEAVLQMVREALEEILDAWDRDHA